ncbi:MAG: hypothetical protein KDA49_03685 [Rhodospirillaceae bacterium]|nr:hypothetical protein [Rhodospirillaceae bacterium]
MPLIDEFRSGKNKSSLVLALQIVGGISILAGLVAAVVQIAPMADQLRDWEYCARGIRNFSESYLRCGAQPELAAIGIISVLYFLSGAISGLILLAFSRIIELLQQISSVRIEGLNPTSPDEDGIKRDPYSVNI